MQDRIFRRRNFAHIYQLDESVVANGTVTPDSMGCDEELKSSGSDCQGRSFQRYKPSRLRSRLMLVSVSIQTQQFVTDAANLLAHAIATCHEEPVNFFDSMNIRTSLAF